MKKLMFLALITLIFSCEKIGSLDCYSCKTVAKNITSEIITCELSSDEIRQFEIALRLQAMIITDSLAVVTCIKTKCPN